MAVSTNAATDSQARYATLNSTSSSDWHAMTMVAAACEIVTVSRLTLGVYLGAADVLDRLEVGAAGSCPTA